MGDLGSIPGSGRSPGEGNDNPLQYSCLENYMDRGAWWATVHGVTESNMTKHSTEIILTLEYLCSNLESFLPLFHDLSTTFSSGILK